MHLLKCLQIFYKHDQCLQLTRKNFRLILTEEADTETKKYIERAVNRYLEISQFKNELNLTTMKLIRTRASA